jgi:hypothetical protein
MPVTGDEFYADSFTSEADLAELIKERTTLFMHAKNEVLPVLINCSSSAAHRMNMCRIFFSALQNLF